MSVAKVEDMSDGARRWWTRALGRDELALHVQAKSVGLSAEDMQAQREVEFPVNRDACRNGPRPCPFARCTHHLGINVTGFGAIRELEDWMEDGPRSEEH